jgi:DNA-binding transcriptional MocR family regulator
MKHSGNEPLIGRPDPGSGEPLYLQVAQGIEEALRAGRLSIGNRLPAERELALEIGVSRTTVTGAYQELQARGILRGHVGRGTTVVGMPPDARHARRGASPPLAGAAVCPGRAGGRAYRSPRLALELSLGPGFTAANAVAES